MREKLVELVKQGYNKYFNPNWALDLFELIADHLIANDVVPVVRCKDCKHCRLASWGERYCIRDKFVEWGELKDDDFCSYGERKDNG